MIPRDKKKKLQRRAERIERDVRNEISLLKTYSEEAELDYEQIRKQAWKVVGLCTQAQKKVAYTR